MGTCFPLVCTLTGLTGREMPTGKESFYVKVPGLALAVVALTSTIKKWAIEISMVSAKYTISRNQQSL